MSRPLLQAVQYPPVFRRQVFSCQRRSKILREVNVFYKHVGKVPLEDAREVTRWIADRMEQHPLEKFEPVRKSQFERGLYDRADEGLEAGIGVGDLDLSAGADDAERKHPRCMNQLHGTMDRKAA